MAHFFVNGKQIADEKNHSLLRFLRDELHLTSAKDGCSEGACGTCTVLIDGKAVRACTVKTNELEGRSVITAEGLSAFEKDVYTYAFGEAGAVQCGFCIPGMVICAKGLLDRNPNPSEADVRQAIRYNICRCTGYVKIVQAILLAAEIFRNGELPTTAFEWKLGSNVHRVDVRDKVTGTGIYPDDLYFDDMLHVVAVRSKYPRARILEIHSDAAKILPGVTNVFTAADIPGNNKVGHIYKDWNTMIPVGGITHFPGDTICLIVAESREIAETARDLVKVDYEVLPFVDSIASARRENAPLVHQTDAEGQPRVNNLYVHKHVSRGHADEAIRNSKYTLHEVFNTPWTEHAFLEPETAVSVPTEEGGVKIYSTDQGVYDTQHETAPMLGLPMEKVIVQNCYVGGGFGGKEDVTVQHLSALAAFLTQKPCKMKLSRAESMQFHPKRHPMEMEFTIGCDENGIIQGVKAEVHSDTGAYASLGGPVLERACTHAAGPYNYQNFEIDGYAWYTNNPPAGAFRGFGVTQTCFCIETLLNRMADKVGISRWEMRYRNAIRPGQELPNGQIADNSTALEKTLEAVKEDFEKNEFVGIACAMKNAGVGVGLPDTGRVCLRVRDGKVIIHCGGSCIGQGLGTVLKQIVCDVTGLNGENVTVQPSNTLDSPDSGTTSGSRHTTISGEAARRASELLKAELTADLSALEGREFYAEYFAKTDPLGSPLPNPVSHVAYGYATQLCVLDKESGKVKKMIAAHAVGKAVNPRSVEGQIEGGVVMGMGFALREKFPLKEGRPMVKYGGLGLFRADEVPEIKPIIVEKAGLSVAQGAIGLGEITSIPTAPAIADAYAHYDGILRSELPLKHTPYAPKLPEILYAGNKRLRINKDAHCIGCLECVRACARTYFKEEDRKFACLAVTEKSGEFHPTVCIQCGKCARVCPTKAIQKNTAGVYIINKNLCTACGTCRDACPFHIMPENPFNGKTAKCIACGICVQNCPMNVLIL